MLHYPAFQAHLHGDKFSYELARDLSRETAWEAVMRIRCGKGNVLCESAYFCIGYNNALVEGPVVMQKFLLRI